MIDKLVRGDLPQGVSDDVIDELAWYILPMANPDGYEYSFSDDRDWRKTRSVRDSVLCVGVDANRNFPDHWAEVGNDYLRSIINEPLFQSGSSAFSCNLGYHGPSEGSEMEVQNMMDFLGSLDNLVFYQNLHAFSQLIMTPYGWTGDLPANYDELVRLAEIVSSVRGQCGY